MIFFTLILLSIITLSAVFANPIDIGKAQQIGKAFLETKAGVVTF